MIISKQNKLHYFVHQKIAVKNSVQRINFNETS
jgi:hypothetical protein